MATTIRRDKGTQRKYHTSTHTGASLPEGAPTDEHIAHETPTQFIRRVNAESCEALSAQAPAPSTNYGLMARYTSPDGYVHLADRGRAEWAAKIERTQPRPMAAITNTLATAGPNTIRRMRSEQLTARNELHNEAQTYAPSTTSTPVVDERAQLIKKLDADIARYDKENEILSRALDVATTGMDVHTLASIVSDTSLGEIFATRLNKSVDRIVAQFEELKTYIQQEFPNGLPGCY